MSYAMDELVIDSLRQISDLDAWYEIYIGNGFADKYPSVQFYLRALYEAERDRRKQDQDFVPDYPSGDFESWPDHALIQFAMFSVGAAELVALNTESKPTVTKWSLDLLKATTALVCSRLSGRSTAMGT